MRFGPYGGRYVPEVLIAALDELTAAWDAARDDPALPGSELDDLLRDFVGRPTPLYLAERLSERVGRRVYLKREDLAHTGAHKINNAVGQALLAKRMGKRADHRRDRRRPARRRDAPRPARCSDSSASSTWAPRTCAGSGQRRADGADGRRRSSRSRPALAR